MLEKIKTLNLGSGKDSSIPDAITVDKNPGTKPDIVHDLNQFPWPIASNTFDVVYCRDLIEHLDDVVKVMEELHRICKKGAMVHMTTPHFSCYNSYTDPTHKHHLGVFSFDYFTGENQWDFYTQVRFKKRRAETIFQKNLKNKMMWRLAKRFPAFYEEHLTWIFPAWYLYFELEVIK